MLIMENKYEFLSKYAIDLNEAAAKGKLDPVIGRDDEIRRVLHIRSRGLMVYSASSPRQWNLHMVQRRARRWKRYEYQQ